MQELKDRVRPVTDKDKGLPTFSYSKIEVFKNCPLQYKFKYMDKKYSQDTSIALELGSLCHYVLETKGKMIASGQAVDYDKLNNILQNGVTETDEKTKEELLGVAQLRRKYFEVWHEADNASGASYEEKIKLFDKVLHEEMEDTTWQPTYFEKPFEFIWDNKVILKGFIDRIDVKDGQYRTVDYKTSKKIYDQSKLATSLQFGIYALAILNEFGELPIESQYRFILIDDEQYALTKGWEKRLIKALDKVFGDIEASENKNLFIPKPTPLCHWCNFCTTNPEATIYKNECEYYSKWTPTQKTFEVNKKWNALENNNTEKKRKLVLTEEKLKMIEPIYDSFENEDIKDFCKLLVSELPLYWWKVPASSTGKYHPAYALGDGGLMRHSIAVVRFLNWFFNLEQYQNKFTDRERDLLRCAGLVHDGRKSGASDDVKEVFTVFDHPLLMAEAVRKHKEDAVISDKEIELIANAIESHMGQWTTSNKPKDAGIVLPKPSNKYQEIVHLADYLASRKPLDMEFDEWKKPELPPLDTYVLNFGKYKNERLVEVAQKDKGYIDWLKENYGREPVRSLLKQL